MAFSTRTREFFQKVARNLYTERRDTLRNNALYSEDSIPEPPNQRGIKLMKNILIYFLKFLFLVFLFMCIFVKVIIKLFLHVCSKTVGFFSACVRVVVELIWARNVLGNRRHEGNKQERKFERQKYRNETMKLVRPKYYASDYIRWETPSPKHILNINNLEHLFRAGRGVFVNRVGRGAIYVSNDQGILGRGGFGTVRMGTITLEDNVGRTIQQKKVAIKTIKGVYSMHDIRGEVTALLRCYPHPSIPEVHFLVIDYGKVLIGMDYCQDGNLSQHRFLDLYTARRWFLQIVEAISHCHQRGIAHLDIKPSNILVNNGDIMVSDFGLSLVLPGETPTFPNQFQTHRRCGTPGYMAPEVAHITGPYDARKADVWSLGIVLHEMVTGRYPYGGKLAFSSSKIPEGAKRLVTRMLNANPNLRPSMEDIRRDPWLSAGW